MLEIKFHEIEKNISYIKALNQRLLGNINYNDSRIESIVEKKNDVFYISVNAMIDTNIDEVKLDFSSEKIHLEILASITSHKNNIDFIEKWATRYSKGNIYSFRSKGYIKDSPFYKRSYFYTTNSRLLYDYFGTKSYLVLTINANPVILTHKDDYIIIESKNKIESKLFSEVCYNIMVAIGFVSGSFIQNELYTFQYKDEQKQELLGYEYRKLRPSSFSMYHSLTGNPFSYKHLIGEDYSDFLYKNQTLKCLDVTSLSNLIELIHNNNQIQYALVLFNEANSRNLSLLIKNNCFYTVLEVLKKFFHEKFENQLPKEYSQKGNIEKYRMIFQNVISLSDEELETIEKRNTYLHGDIKNIEGDEMTELMRKQLTLIYRIVLTYIGFDGYIIDHYFMQKSIKEKSFIKLN